MFSSKPNTIIFVAIHATKSEIAVISNLTLSDCTMDCCKNKIVYCMSCTVDILSTNGFGTGRVPWYASRHIRLVNVYNVRLNVYKIKR